MSKFEMEDQGAQVYVLPDDARVRLHQVHKHLVSLRHMAQADVRAGEEGELGAAATALGVSLDLLAEEMRLTLDAVYSAARPPVVVHETSDDDPLPDHLLPPDPRTALVFGLTLDQLDRIAQLVAMVGAHGDVVAAVNECVVSVTTLPLMGHAIVDNAAALRRLLDDAEGQRLASDGRARSGVREDVGTYLAHARRGVSSSGGLPASYH